MIEKEPLASEMTLRDAVALMALFNEKCPFDAYESKKRAQWAYCQADAFMAEREKRRQ
jgi:hypothetical protein